MRLKIAICCSAALTGCVSFQTKMTNGLWTFDGQDVRQAIGALGYPADERQIAGDHLYIWRTGGGVVAGAFPVGNSMFAFAGRLQCEITMTVNAHGIVERSYWQGNLGGCAPWSRMLYERYKAVAAQ